MAAFYTVNMYPVQFNVDYPEEPMNRVSTLLRAIYVLPIWLILAGVSGSLYTIGFESTLISVAEIGGILFVPIVLMLLFQKNTPGGGSTGTWLCCNLTTGSSHMPSCSPTYTPPLTRNSPYT
jgi:hypothetical protein